MGTEYLLKYILAMAVYLSFPFLFLLVCWPGQLAYCCWQKGPKVCKALYGPAAGSPCVFPFKWRGVSYSGCARIYNNRTWCSTSTDANGEHVSGFRDWGYCDKSSCSIQGGTTSPPGSTTPLPGTDTSLPGTTTSLPRTETSFPKTKTFVPVSSTSLPGSTTSLPETTTSVPVTSTSQIGSTTSLPGTDTPDITTSLPGTKTSVPGSTSALPGTDSSLPGTNTPLPGTTTPLPKTMPSVSNADYCSINPRHTICVYTGPSDACSGKTILRGMTNAGKAATLAKHNELRRRVAKGEEPGQPGAGDMRELVWDEELEAIAQRWADQCTLS